MGVRPEQMLELSHYQTSKAFDKVERTVLDLAVEMAKTPTNIPAELTARLREYFDEAQLVELAAAIAWEHYRARFNRVFGVRSAGFSEGDVCALPERHAGA
jgi:alkylhydroperoxidase family enzyme